MRLTARDTDLLETLTHKVRVVSLRQAALHFWGSGAGALSSARSRIAVLEREGLIESSTRLAWQTPPVTAPILTWSPGAPAPDFGPIAFRLRARFTGILRSTRTAIATEEAGHRFGGVGGRSSRASELSHDLGLAALYFRLKETDPHRASRWLSEALLHREGRGRNEKLPDAVIREPEGETLIEFAGRYPKRKLEEFHRHCVERNLNYELW